MTTLEACPIADLRPESKNGVRRPGVLVAVADETTRTSLAGFLAGRGFDVWTAGSGLDALTVYVEHPGVMDVVLLDDDFTDLPGPAFLRRFRTHFPSVPCVFRTEVSTRQAEKLRERGATVVPRTIPPAVLVERLWETVAFPDDLEA